MRKELLIVDGYNIIGAWPHLVKLKNQDKMEDARDSLLHELSNYQKYTGIKIRVVFDAQFVPGLQQSYQKYQLSVIFTKEGETADSYIERIVGIENTIVTQVTVATSDLAEQWVVFQKGALRKSANELFNDVKRIKKAIEADTQEYRLQSYRRNSPWSHDQLNNLEKLRDDLTKR
ncbi:NYN domain-containing protein [Carnobacterium pleistocenium]|uniref:NYN domain-containing protein n=1 Tax=Carnobacterium pleistocenium TaxID=181073 RepID=UPI0005553233|nr:NYN domain-containing protein [Carnobacterium pleistocenium]